MVHRLFSANIRIYDTVEKRENLHNVKNETDIVLTVNRWIQTSYPVNMETEE